MPAPTVPITGNGATISGLGVTTQLTGIEGFSIEREGLDISVLATTSYKKMRPTDLATPPEVKVTFFWLGADGSCLTNMTSISEPYAGTTVTITFPNSGGAFAGKAFVKSFEFPSCKNGEVMQGSYTLQFDGNSIGFTPT